MVYNKLFPKQVVLGLPQPIIGDLSQRANIGVSTTLLGNFPYLGSLE